jgi:hypothetical protein
MGIAVPGRDERKNATYSGAKPGKMAAGVNTNK